MFNKSFISILALFIVGGVLSCKNPVATNSAPVASFYTYNYLVSNSGILGVNGEYSYFDDYGTHPSYFNGTYYIFYFNFGSFYWGIDTVRNITLSSRFYYILNGSDSRPPESVSWEVGANGTAPGPVVSAVSPISGNTDEEAGYTLRGNYIYSDADDDLEAGSVYKWYRCTSSIDSGVEIDGAIEQTYTTTAADDGLFLRFEVTPVDEAGNTGSSLLSDTVKIGI